MSGSRQEVQDLADKILDVLGKRIGSGELVIRFCSGVVQRCETRTVHEIARPLRKTGLDSGKAEGAF